MSGAIAGTAIMGNLFESKRLQMVTLTINNDCNMKCPHCYMQYNGEKSKISGQVLDAVYESSFKHLAIVGKEPFFDASSVDVLKAIVEKCRSINRSVSVVTNGTQLLDYDLSFMRFIDFVDISLDGGAKWYGSYRGDVFDKVLQGVDSMVKLGVKVNALHVLNNKTLEMIDEMVAVNECAEFDKIMLSPYLRTENFGVNDVSSVGFYELFDALKKSGEFMRANNAILLIDRYHMIQWGISFKSIVKMINEYGMTDKVFLVEKDPIEYGVIRVTYDDCVMSPEDSLHPTRYGKIKYKASKQNIDKLFSDVKFERVAS